MKRNFTLAIRILSLFYMFFSIPLMLTPEFAIKSLSTDIEINAVIIKLLEGQGVLFFLLGIIMFLITLKIRSLLSFNYMVIPPLIIMTFFSIYYYNYFQSQSLIYMIILHFLVLVVLIFEIIGLKKFKANINPLK
tara:strand:- start:32 stop:436 length:405 start_codon:yes stop_codon:yes gene_type:complete